MATHAINKANSRLRFLYRQNKFLDIPLGRRHWEYWRLQPRKRNLTVIYIFFHLFRSGALTGENWN